MEEMQGREKGGEERETVLTVLTVLKPLQTSVVLLACWLSGCGPDLTAPEGGGNISWSDGGLMSMWKSSESLIIC